MSRLLIGLAVVLLGWEAQAASVMKCVDAAGKVTFVQNANCPTNTGLTDVVNAHNASPSGSSAAVPLADTSKPKAKKSSGQSYTVVGEQPAPAAAPAVKSEPEPPVVVRPANQPCVKLVDQRYTYSKVDKKGRQVSGAGIRKVVVPC